MTAPFVSFAQNFEDVLLARCFEGSSGTYVDVGSHHPVLDSTTCAFYRRGWRGLNIDALDTHHHLFGRLRQGDVNVVCAVGDRPGTLPFYVLPGTGLSTLSETIAARHAKAGFVVKTRELPIETMAALLDRHAITDIDFLKIDVEGAERAVLEGMDWRRWRPKVVIVEATAPMSSERNSAGWASLLQAAEYECAAFDGLNEYWTVSEDQDLAARLDTPANVFDEFVRARELTLHRCFHHTGFRLWLRRLLPLFQRGTCFNAEHDSHRAALDTHAPNKGSAHQARRQLRTVTPGAALLHAPHCTDPSAAIKELMHSSEYKELLVWGHSLVKYLPERTA